MDDGTSQAGALSRRMFVRTSAIALTGAFLTAPAIVAAQDCRPTEPDIVGPFYKYGAPFRTRLADATEPGDRLIVSGTLYSSDCRTPIPRVLMDVWQANHAGQYDTNEPGNFTDPTTFHLRGRLRTDEKGRYEIETVMPGRYPIPPGLPGLEKYAGHTRPAHIHLQVMESLHIPLTTQLYFKGDPYLAGDPWAGRKPSLAIDLKQEGQRLRGVFDIVLSTGL